MDSSSSRYFVEVNDKKINDLYDNLHDCIIFGKMYKGLFPMNKIVIKQEGKNFSIELKNAHTRLD